MVQNEGKATSMIEAQSQRIPTGTWMFLAVGSIVVSAGLALSGRLKVANFIGQWVPSLLIIGVYNKLVKVFNQPQFGQQLQGDLSSQMKAPTDYSRQTPATPPRSPLTT